MGHQFLRTSSSFFLFQSFFDCTLPPSKNSVPDATIALRDFTLLFDAPPTMSHGLSKDEVEDLKEAFNMFDVDGGGEWHRGGIDAVLGHVFISI
eukprot:scaffold7070_cov108-Skeletonema_menzelii.AAC.3